jgi:hypothetical protein
MGMRQMTINEMVCEFGFTDFVTVAVLDRSPLELGHTDRLAFEQDCDDLDDHDYAVLVSGGDAVMPVMLWHYKGSPSHRTDLKVPMGTSQTKRTCAIKETLAFLDLREEDVAWWASLGN